MAQHFNFVHTCEFFAVISFGYASIYYIFGHYPTIKNQVVEMEEFSEEKPPNYEDNQLQLESERPGGEGREKFRENKHNHQRVFNDTVETLDNE
jgi:hypothetical protein